MKWLILSLILVNLVSIANFEEILTAPELTALKNMFPVSKFINGEKLRFVCSNTNGRNAEIVLEEKDRSEIKVPIGDSRSVGRNSIIEGTYVMNFSASSVDVICRLFNSQLQIITNRVMTLFRDTDTVVNNGKSEKQTGFFENESNLMWIYIGAGICVLIILIAGIIKAFTKGKREDAMIQRASVNYEHFTNESQEPMPLFPRGPTLEQTYLAPVDLQEAPYAVSRPQETETYALPYTPKNVEELYSKPVPKTSRMNLYTQVLPKSLRKQQDSSKYVNTGVSDELTYAEIGHQNQNYANVEKIKGKPALEDNYATIAHSTKAYANMSRNNDKKDENYTNVFGNDPYVNAKRDEYAEPTYCELSRK